MAISYSDDNEGTHAAGPDLDWQESVFVHWYDPTAGIGGAHRLGHEPNRDNGGRSALECFVFTTKGTRFRRVDYQLPLEEPTTPRGFRAGGSSWHVDGGSPRLEIHEPGLDANLTMENFYPLTDFFPPSGSMVEDFAKHHYETSGRITGPVTIAGTTIDVDGMCHRDHSWGTRKADTLLSHRWVSGTFGPDLSFGSIVWHAADDSLVKVGYLVRDGEVIYADDVDVIAWLEPDGLTIRGGQVTWQLPDRHSPSTAAKSTPLCPNSTTATTSTPSAQSSTADAPGPATSRSATIRAPAPAPPGLPSTLPMPTASAKPTTPHNHREGAECRRIDPGRLPAATNL